MIVKPAEYYVSADEQKYSNVAVETTDHIFVLFYRELKLWSTRTFISN